MNTGNIRIDVWRDDAFAAKEVQVAIARFDLVHPVISGNKRYKLQPYIDACNAQPGEKLITFGGAWSNHLAATAAACREENIACIGFVRGEAPAIFSPVLKFCADAGMQLRFLSREEYAKAPDEAELQEMYGNAVVVPEGGFSKSGAEGARGMADDLRGDEYNYLCTALGTATTAAGLYLGKKANARVLAVPVLKNLKDIDLRVKYLTGRLPGEDFMVADNYHFGGYAKHNSELLAFMNAFYLQHKVPSDFVYTAKMLYAVDDLIRKDFFPKNSKVICIHTGGLSGNAGLPAGSLIF